MLFATLLLGITITLPAETSVVGTELRLGAIAEIVGDEATRAADVSAVSLGYAPAPGFTRVLDRAAIARQVRARFGAVAIEFDGAPTVRVMPRVERVSAESLVAAARRALDGGLDERDAEVELRAAPAAVEVPAGTRPYELRAELPPGGVRPGTLSVPIQVLVDGQPYRTVRTSWSVDVWRDVPVLLRDVPSGERLSADAVAVQRMRLGRDLRGEPLAPSLALGNVATRDLHTGDVLTKRDVRRPSLIRRGDAVYLEVRKGAIVARIEAVAQRDGARGDRIPVVVTSSQKAMAGTVASRDTVVVDLESPAR